VSASDLLKTVTDPELGESKPPITLSSVVFPEPEGPTKPVNSPFPKVRFTFFSAVKKSPPTGKRLTKLLIVTTEFAMSSFLF
jgi:hypothetical protein